MSDMSKVPHLRLQEEESKEAIGAMHRMATGTSGTRIFSARYDEEFLGRLNGTEKADLYDKMLRSDGQLNMLYTARKNPILSANWFVESASDDPEHVKHQKFAEYVLFRGMQKSFREFLDDILSFIIHGYSVFERIHQVVDDDPFLQELVGKPAVIYRNIAWRSQRTIEEFELNRDGSIKRIFQQADGDLEAFTDIDGKWINVFSLGKLGDNYEGISAFRPLVGNWERKQIFNKLLAIGIERYAVGTPIGTIPAGKENSPEKDVFAEILQKFTSHEKAFILKPAGWDLDYTKNAFDASKVIDAISAENLEMAKSFVAPHLELGTGGNTGAFALATDFSDQFLSIIQNDAEIPRREINKVIIKEIIDFNFGKQSVYPELKVSGINDKAGKELADIIKSLGQARVLTPTTSLENFVRDQYKLPQLSEQEEEMLPNVRKVPEVVETAEALANAAALAEASKKKDNLTKFQLADMRKTNAVLNKTLKEDSKELRALMQKELGKRADKMIDSLGNKLRKTTLSRRRSLVNQVEMKGQKDYRDKLTAQLLGTANTGVNTARRETPGGSKIKFWEISGKRLKLDEIDDLFKNLPPNTRNMIRTEVSLLAGSQDADLEKQIRFALAGSVDTTQDVEVILKDLRDAKETYLLGPSVAAAAGNSTAKVMNTARMDFFQAPDVLEEIEALQFTNPDPQAPICVDLAGRIFAKDDPIAQQFLPPLHFNCKSFIVPIFELGKREIDPIGLQPSNRKAIESINL